MQRAERKKKMFQNERPILFSPQMVRAILDGRKVETRRVIKPQPVPGEIWKPSKYSVLYWDVDPEWIDLPSAFCPLGLRGDLLWVRERFGYVWPDDCDDGLIYDEENLDGRPITRDEMNIVFYADRPDFLWFDEEAEDQATRKHWKPSIFLPKKRARIWLEIVSVYVQRLQKVTEENARAEGFDSLRAFREYWDKLNLKRGFGWEADPVVWAILFRKVEKK